jgi:ABC-type transport system involved in cytochrome c biogenesis permease subunit
MNWLSYPLYALISAIFWMAGIILLFFEYKTVAIKFIGRISVLLGCTILAVFLTLLWHYLGRPPIQTVGETRIWYAVFIVLTGYVIYLRLKSKIILFLCLAIAIFFLWINYSHPEVYDKTLAPELQSPWFVPHVIVYIVAYALLGAATLTAITGLLLILFRKFEIEILNSADNLVYAGFSLLTLGILFGAIWAKEVWGHYWTWDPKESWSLLTWLVYVLYIHYRFYYPHRTKTHLGILSVIFVVVVVCWFGFDYLPSVQQSLHVFGR